MSKYLDEQVVVVGAGPTGLMLACELKLAGADVTVIEKRPSGTGESRAPGINARTMEIFELRGLAAQFRGAGRALPAVLFSGIPMAPKKHSPGWPDALILPQHETERILRLRAAELGVTIHWSSELVHLIQDRQGVGLSIEADGQQHDLRAQYVVGCDGGHSSVRRACGARFDGDDALSHWLVADVKLAAPPGEGQAFGRNTRVGTYQVSQVEPGWFRVSLMTVAAPQDRNSPVTLEELRQAMLAGLGTDHGLQSARWMSRFTDGFRQAENYRHGRVFLAGDAAHTHAPIGGQGLNLGIQDALNLGWKLAAVLTRGVDDTLLDTYQRERHPVAQAALQMTKAQTALIKPGKQIDALREVVAKMLAVPEVGLDLAGTLSGLSLQYPWGMGQHPLLGRRMPNLMLTTAGEQRDVYSFMHQARPLLLNFGGGGQAAVPARWRTLVDGVDAQVHLGDHPSIWQLPATGAVPALSAALVRPDGYIAWVSQAGDPSSPASLVEALHAWIG